MWASHDCHRRDVFVAKTSPEFFVLAKNRSAPYRCTGDHINMYGADNPKCAYDNHAFYQATDEALFDIMRGCAWCTHVLVTNSDNTYHPDFLVRTLREEVDMVITNFVHKGKYLMVADWQLAKLDLGGIVFSKAILQKVGGFIAALPQENCGPAHTHDNDYYFVMKALELGVTNSKVPLYLFSHN
jgi:hypothetical protein